MKRRMDAILTVSLTAVLLTAAASQLKPSHAAAGRASEALAKERTKPVAVPGRLLVKYRAGASSQQRKSIMLAAGTRFDRELRGLGVHVIDLTEGADEEACAQMLRARPEVEFVERDYIVYPASTVTPDDPLNPSQWHLPAISCPAAWGVTTGSNQITIAVCDTGVDATHPDLSSKLVPGWNVADNNADTSAVADHGTWTSGTAAAIGNNAIGVASPAWNCSLMPIRVTSLANGAALTSDLAAGVMWAADHGARVASVSFMAGASNIMASAGSYIQSKGGVLVMAAGNTGTYTSTPDSSSIIIASSTDQSDAVTGFSTTGSYVDVAAPGSAILTTAPGNTYQAVSGSSFSTPLVAGAAALMLSANPNLTPAQLDTILKVTADDLGPAGWDPGYGWGRLNAGRAVIAVAAILEGASDGTAPALGFAHPQIGGDVDGLLGISQGELVAVNALDDRGVTEVSLFADGAPKGTITSAPYNFHWDTSSFTDGSQHTLTAVAKDQAGNTTSISTTVTLRTGFDATPPAVSFVQPQPNGRINISPSELVRVDASDNGGATSVFLFADDAFVGEIDSSPYTFTLDTSSFASGSQHTLLALAADQAGNSSSASITVTAGAPPDVTAPSVTFVRPQLNGSVGISAAETIEISAQDNVGVVSIKLSVDGRLLGTLTAAPYRFTWNTTPLAVGSRHVLTAVAADQAGNSTTASITVTIRDTVAPQVSFISPQNGDRVNGNETVSVRATDNVAVTRVEFFADDKLVTSWTRPPYTVKWKANKLARGSHTLKAIAYDAAGNSGSTTITVTAKKNDGDDDDDDDDDDDGHGHNH